MGAMITLDYASPHGNPEPARPISGALGTLLSILLMSTSFFCVPAYLDDYRVQRDADYRRWSENAIVRRDFERDRRLGLSVGLPPHVAVAIAPYWWVPDLLAVFAGATVFVSLVIGRVSHHALYRTGHYEKWSARWKWRLVGFTLMQIAIASIGYGRYAFAFYEPYLAVYQWLIVATLIYLLSLRGDKIIA